MSIDLGTGANDAVNLGNANNSITVTNVETVTGGAGNDTITATTATRIVAVGGVDNLTGSSGADTFVFTTDLTIGDTVTGGAGEDTLEINIPQTANILIGANVTGVEVLAFAGSYDTGVVTLGSSVTKVTGSNADNQAITLTGLASGVSFELGTTGGDADTVTLADGTNTITVKGVETVTGGAGNDSVGFEADSTSAIDGGAGSDTVLLGDIATTTNTISVTGVESISGGAGADLITFTSAVTGTTMSGGGGADVITLDDGANTDFRFNTGITGTVTINGDVGAFNDTVVVSGSGAATFASGAGDDKLTGGLGNDVFTFGNSEYTPADTINGGAGTDTIKLTADSAVVATNVTNVEILLLDSGVDATAVDLTGSGITQITAVSDATDETVAFADIVVTGITINLGDGAADAVTLGNATNSITVTNVEFVNGGTGKDTITTTTAATITGGGGADVLTGSSGADTFVYSGAGNVSSLTSLDTITNFGATDTIALAGAGAFNPTVVDVSLASSLIEAANLVSSGDGSGGNAIGTWFQYGGNTYVVEDLSVSTSFVNGTDQIIKLTGIVDLSLPNVAFES